MYTSLNKLATGTPYAKRTPNNQCRGSSALAKLTVNMAEKIQKSTDCKAYNKTNVPLGLRRCHLCLYRQKQNIKALKIKLKIIRK